MSILKEAVYYFLNCFDAIFTPTCHVNGCSYFLHLVSEPNWHKIGRSEGGKGVFQKFVIAFSVTEEVIVWVGPNKFQFGQRKDESIINQSILSKDACLGKGEKKNQKT